MTPLFSLHKETVPPTSVISAHTDMDMNDTAVGEPVLPVVLQSPYNPNLTLPSWAYILYWLLAVFLSAATGLVVWRHGQRGRQSQPRNETCHMLQT